MKLLTHPARRFVDTPVAELRQKIFRAMLAIAFVIAFGTGGIYFCEAEWSVWNSLYFTLITITTVGYGDMGISEAGQRFTSVLLVVGIATTTYAFGQLMQAVIGHQLAWRNRMQKTVDELSGHTIICGAGRVGRSVCESLERVGQPFLLIDIQKTVFDWAIDQGYLAVSGCATDDDVLRRAGIERAGGIVCAASDDADNIMICLSARDLNPDLVIISRADDHESVRKLERAGANHVIAPAVDGGRQIAKIIDQPHVARFLRRYDGEEEDYQLTAIPIPPGSALVGGTPLELGQEEPTVVFVAVQREGEETNIRPPAMKPFEENDVVIILGDREAVQRMGERASRIDPVSA